MSDNGIDTAALWSLLNRLKFPNDWPSADYRRGYAGAVDDIATWLRAQGNEPPSTRGGLYENLTVRDKTRGRAQSRKIGGIT